MKDLQRDRLKHLLANAIMELWKKETGSMSAVLIEATICITSGNGKTTVLQVADKFGGSIPEVEDDNNNTVRQPLYPDPFIRYSLGSPPHFPYKYALPPKVDITNIHSNGGYLDNMSPCPLMSPCIEKSRERRETSPQQSPRLVRTESREQPMDTSSTSKEDEESDSGSEGSREAPVTPVTKRERPRSLTGIGYYTHSTPDSRYDSSQRSQSESSPQLSALNLSSNSDRTDEDKTPSKRLREETEDRDGEGRRAVDLSRSDSDLVLSPPSSYTAQVRDVIRQRLLASKANQEQAGQVKEESGMERPVYDRQDSRGRTPSPVRTDIPRSSPNHIFNHLPPNSMAVINGQLMHRSLSGALMPAPIPLVGQPPLSLMDPMHPMLKHKSDIRSPSPLHCQDALSPNIYPSQTSPPSLDDSSDSPGEKDANGEQRVYKCQYCNKTFLFKSKYHEHLPVHTNARPFQCHLCSRTYKYKYDLRVHLRTHMGIPTKSTVCPFCNAKFDTNKLLRLHIKDAHKDKQKVSEEECTNNNEHLPPAL